MKSSLRNLIERYVRLYNDFQIEPMLELFSDQCHFQNISNSNGIMECHNKEELRKLALSATSAFSERKQTITGWVVAEEKAVIEIDYEATLKIDLPNGLKKGNQIKMKGVSIFEFVDGKISRLADYS